MFSEAPPSHNVFVRYGTRALYIITGIMCCILGIVGAIGISVICVFAGIFLFLVGVFILITEMPFCCAFIPQTEYITRFVEKFGPLPIAIVCALFGIIALAMCRSISMIFAFLFLLASAALRIREFILLRRARTQNSAGLGGEPSMGGGGGAPPAYESSFPPAAPAYGADSMADRMAAGAARGAAQAAFQKPPTY